MASHVATFTPNNALTLSTTYTATITTGARDLFGNALASDFVWTFTTSATPCQSIVPLGSACGFGILAGSTVTNTGPSNVTGDVGVWPGTAITGFPPGTLTGTIHAGDSVAMTAQGDLTTAYNFAAGVAGGQALPADIGGETLAPGVYKTSISLGITGNLTLDGGGDPNAVWIFQIGSTLTTAAGNSQVILTGGAQAHQRVLAGRQFSDAWNQHNIRRNHYGPGVHHAYHRRDAEWQSAGPDGRSHIGQQSGECTSLSMRYSVVRLARG